MSLVSEAEFILKRLMRSHSLLIIIITQFIFFSFQTATAQRNKKNYTTRDVSLGNPDSLKSIDENFSIEFKNLNKIPFYQDPKQLALIRKLEDQKNYAELLPVLENYVSNFGIENFSQNPVLLWKLAQLYEHFGRANKAKSLYRIILKHHRGKELRKILLHYDTLNTDKKEYYVPLQYYYDLVEYRKAIDTLIPPKSVFLNMGELVNDNKFPDYGPSYHAEQDLLVFTKRKKELSATKLSFRENEELYVSKNYDGFWDESYPFSNVINSHCNEGSAYLSRDGKTLFFSRCIVEEYKYDCRDCMGSCDIYVSYFKDSTWTVPENLGPQVNSVSWDSHPTLSHSEDTLYFASDRIGGFGLSDIYFTYKTPKGWAPAQNMGPIFNTRGNEVSPFYHAAHDVFYFSSNGQLLNFGDLDSTDYSFRTMDIYKSVKLKGRWTEPKNIGPLVNGQGEEYYFTIDPKSKDLFYAKTEVIDPKNLDLYSFPLPMEAQPTANIKFSGSLTDTATGNPYKGIVSIIDLTNGIEVAPKYMRPDGSFEFDLIDNNDYLLVIQGEDFFRVEQKFHLEGDTTLNLHTPGLKYNKWKFASIEFEGGSSKILTEMEPDLDKVVNFLLDNPTLKLRISGHTDSDGNSDLNLKLSQKRAQAIKDYIIAKGQIEPDRIEALGFGSQKPIVEEKTDEDKRINRRVEFEIIRPEKK